MKNLELLLYDLIVTVLSGGADADVNIVPSDIASLLFWVEADYGTFQNADASTPAAADSDPVWRVNEHKNNYNLLTTNNDYRPLLKLNTLNGKPTLLFDGVNDGLRASFDRAVPETIFVVCKEESTDSATRSLLSTYALANATHDMFGTATANTLQVGSNVKTITALGLSAAYHVWSYVENNTVSRLHRDGTKVKTGDCDAVNSNGLAVACAGNWLESGGVQGFCHNVSIAEIIIFDGILTPSEHNQVGKYLADKYDLTFYLTVDTLSDNSLATVSLFKNDGVNTYLRPSPNSRAIYSTTATRLYLELYNNTYDTWPTYSGIGIRVNGADFTVVYPTALYTNYKTVTLPAGTKTVEIINGFQHAADGAGPKGTYVMGVSFNAAFTVVAGSVTSRMLIYGDSIAVGAAAEGLPLTGWVQLVKNAYDGTVINESWSSRSLWNDCNDATARTNFANQIAADTPGAVWLAIGYNDRTLITDAGHWVNEAGYAAAYGDLLDKLNAALPTATIYAQTPIITGSEGAGDGILKVRSAIATAQSTRAAFCTLVDGTALVSVGNLSDGVHPTTAGQAEYAAAVKTILGLS